MNHQRGHRANLRAIARRAMMEKGLIPDFEPAVRAETTQIEKNENAGERTGADGPARDLRNLLWASIDNDDSEDLDQRSVAEKLPDGSVKVSVAIADVDGLVEKGSAIDGHARHNTTSVYTAAEIFPMLPLPLSTDLTSLRQDADRSA